MALIFDIPRDLRLDASETLNLRRALEHVRAKTYDKKFPAMKGRLFVPTDNEVNTGAESVTYDTYELLGEAEIVASYADDAPSVDAKASDSTLRIRGMQTKYGYSLQELRAAAMSGSRLSERKAAAARKAIEQKHDTIMLLGDSKWSMVGLFTLTGTNTYTVPNGASGSKDWDTKTSDEILLDLFGMENKILTETNEVETPDTLVLPLTRLKLIRQKRMGDGIDGTVLQFFLKHSDPITNVESSIKLESNSAWTGRRMVAYAKDPEKLVYVEPQPFEQLMPQTTGLITNTFCHSRSGGVQNFYAKSVCYGDGI